MAEANERNSPHPSDFGGDSEKGSSEIAHQAAANPDKRAVKLLRSRSSYLGQVTVCYKNLYDAVARSNNLTHVLSLRDKILQRWERYEQAHLVAIESPHTDAQRVIRLAQHHQRHRQECDDKIRVLEAYRKAETARSQNPTPSRPTVNTEPSRQAAAALDTRELNVRLTRLASPAPCYDAAIGVTSLQDATRSGLLERPEFTGAYTDTADAVPLVAEPSARAATAAEMNIQTVMERPPRVDEVLSPTKAQSIASWIQRVDVARSDAEDVRHRPASAPTVYVDAPERHPSEVNNTEFPSTVGNRILTEKERAKSRLGSERASQANRDTNCLDRLLDSRAASRSRNSATVRLPPSEGRQRQSSTHGASSEPSPYHGLATPRPHRSGVAPSSRQRTPANSTGLVSSEDNASHYSVLSRGHQDPPRFASATASSFRTNTQETELELSSSSDEDDDTYVPSVSETLRVSPFAALPERRMSTVQASPKCRGRGRASLLRQVIVNTSRPGATKLTQSVLERFTQSVVRQPPNVGYVPPSQHYSQMLEPPERGSQRSYRIPDQLETRDPYYTGQPNRQRDNHQTPTPRERTPRQPSATALYASPAEFVTPQPAPPTSTTDLLAMALLNVHLPHPELMTFNGSPKDWTSFIANFQTNIVAKVQDPALRLSYLIQLCSGKAKEAIKDCVLLPAMEGFDKAISILSKQFGSKHTIARAYLDGLRNGPRIAANDVEALVKFASELDTTNMVLSQLNYTCDLNSSDTIHACVKRLPFYLGNDWVKKAAKISLNRFRDPSFADLVTFVKTHAEVANTYYGRENAKNARGKDTQTAGAQKGRVNPKSDNKTKVQTLATVQLTDKPSSPSKGGKRKSRRRAKTKSGSTETKTEPAKVVAQAEAPTGGSGRQPSKKACPHCDVDTHKLSACRKLRELPLKEKTDIVMRAGLCFRCFKPGHQARECEAVCSQCGRNHHAALHDEAQQSKTNTAQAETSKTELKRETATVTAAVASSGRVWFSIVPVVIHGREGVVKTHAFIDSGSNTTLMTRELFDRLGVESQQLDYSIRTLGAEQTHGNQLEGVVEVSSLDGAASVTVRVSTVDDLPVGENGDKADMDAWPHLKNIEVPSIGRAEVGLLIGMDCPELQWSLEEVRGGPGEPFARRTLLGWTIVGPSVKKSPHQRMTNKSTEVHAILSDVLQKQLERQWNVDFQDLNAPDAESASEDDKRALEIMQNSVSMVNGKYQLAVPWKSDPEDLPNNRRAAEVRLQHLRRKLQRNDDLRQQYSATVEKYVADGHARKLTANEARASGPQWYLPHHPVFKRSNPAKCRVVFDCAAKYKGTALNDVIHQGPNFLNNLAGVLLRFRREKVAVVGDIEAMFHQCHVTKRDQQFLRFLWWEAGDITKQHSVYCMTVHLFGATSSPSVACFCLRKTASDGESEFSEQVIDTLRRGFYMDDMLKSVATDEEAISLIQDITALLGRGGFRLTKFVSTSRRVIESVPEEERAKSLRKELSDDALPQESALGLQWLTESDCFTYDVDFERKPWTKRGLLSMTASLYDPLGFVGPVVLLPRLTQQELCRRQLEWDDSIPEELLQKTVKWFDDIAKLRSIRIPRCIKPEQGTDNRLELHTFSDASEYAYGAGVYARYSSEAEIRVCLLIGKSRVAPLKIVSIPRLELTAAVVACQLYQFVIRELDLTPHSCHFWTDSTTVLRYLENTSSRYKIFVAHRVSAIREASDVSQWRYVPTAVNPADLASRGIEPSEQDKLSKWIEGPEFLRDHVESYDSLFARPTASAEVDLEVRVNAVTVSTARGLQRLIEYYSAYHKLCRAVAWFQRFALYRRGIRNREELSVEDLRRAEWATLRYVQRQAFPEEIERLERQESVSNRSVLSALDPFIGEQGLVRVGGRLQECTADVQKHPIVLPKHHVAELIVRGLHEASAHVGVNHTLSLLRKKFYLPAGYSVVKSIIGRCIPCKMHHGNTMSQKMANLPSARVRVDDPPFANVGIDYFGPMLVKFRRGTAKRWGCLFTCLVTRAVHLEVAHELSADSFLMAYHRFVARRGKPGVVYSDNGSNFVAAERELQEEVKAINSSRVRNAMLAAGVEWHFTPPYAPHFGGVWERLVKGVKSTLRALIGHRLLSDEELLSFLAEAEKILNDRPLTPVRADHRDAVPLTPSDLLLLRGNSCESPIADENPLRRRWATVQALANAFYARFVDEYLPTLQSRSKWTSDQRAVQENDVVLVACEDKPRGQWPLGLVTEPIVSEDGRVRAAYVKIDGMVRRRPVTQLVFLEHQE